MAHCALLSRRQLSEQAHDTSQVLTNRPPDLHRTDHEPDTTRSGLTPLFRWRWPVLEAPYPLDKDVHLAGRGLLLVPSYFCRRMPVTFADPGLPPVLVYPITTVDTEPDKSGELRGPAAEPDRGLARPDADGNGS